MRLSRYRSVESHGPNTTSPVIRSGAVLGAYSEKEAVTLLRAYADDYSGEREPNWLVLLDKRSRLDLWGMSTGQV